MFIVTKKQGESDDSLLARFRKKTVMSGLLLELRDRERFKKPSERKKEKRYKIEFNRMLEKKRNYWKMKTIPNFLSEVKLELEKVTWPKRDVVVNYLSLVIIISIIVAAFVGSVDFSLTKLLEYFLQK